MRTVHIETKQEDVAAAAKELLAALRLAGRRAVTAADATVLSGLPLHHAEPALLHLAGQLPADLSVTATGDLRVTFATLTPPSPPRGLRVWAAAAWTRHRPALARWAAWNIVLAMLFGIAAGVMSFGEGALADGSQENSPLYIIGLVPALLTAFLLTLSVFPVFMAGATVALTITHYAELSLWAATGRSVAFLAMALLLGYAYGKLAAFLLRLAARGRDPVGGILGLLFGPKKPHIGALEDERALTAWIRRREGVVSARDLVLLFGWTLQQADRQLVRILVDYGGDLVVSEEGGIAYHFDALGAATEARPAPPPPLAAPGPLRFFGCSRSFLTAAIVVLGLSAVLAAVREHALLFPGPDDIRAALAVEDDPLELLFRPGLGWWLHSLIGVIWCARLPGWLRARNRRRARLRWLELVAFIDAHPEGGWTPIHRFQSGDVARAGGDFDLDRVDAEGRAWLRFEALEVGQRAADALRSSGRSTTDACG